MPQHVATLLRGLGHDLEAATGVEHGREFDELAVQLGGNGRLGESGTDVGGHVEGCDAVTELAARTVRERQLDGHRCYLCDQRKGLDRRVLRNMPRSFPTVGG